MRHWDVQGHGDDITGLSFSPDSAIVVSSSRDCSLWVWQVLAGTSHSLVSNVHRCVSFQNRLHKSSESHQTSKVSHCRMRHHALFKPGHLKSASNYDDMMISCAVCTDMLNYLQALSMASSWQIQG